MSAVLAGDALLRWYPREWRERYGPELLAMIEDDLDGAEPSPRLRTSLAVHGLAEHLRRRFGAGPDRSATRRAGARLVMLAWGLFVVAGCSFAKLSEQFQAAMPASAGRVPIDAFNVVRGLSVGGAALVGLAVVTLLPTFVRQVVRTGTHTFDRAARVAVGLVSAASVATVGIAVWAHRLSFHQRNNVGFGAYGIAFLAWAALVAASLLAAAIATITSEARLELSKRLVQVEAGLAAAMAACLVGMLLAVAVWWGALAADAPWFLHGSLAGTGGSPWSFSLVATVALMVTAVAVAAKGCARMARA